MYRLHTLSWRALIGVILCSMSACSRDYQSYQDGGYEEAVAAGQRWETQLPYESSQALDIAVATAQEILLTDKSGPLHITRIPLEVTGTPGRIHHVSFEDADSMEVLDEKQMLVWGQADQTTKSLRLVDRATLETTYSADLPFAKSTDFTVPGWERFGDTLIVYQTAITVDRKYWSDASYRYSFPYVAAAKYDLHVIDLRRRTVQSIAGLEGSSLEEIRTQLAASKTEVEVLAIRTPLHVKNRKPNLEPYLYLVGDLFLVDRGGVLVFELENLDGDSEYFIIDLRAQNPTPERQVASVLAARYPDELVTTPRPEKSGSVDREMRIGGETYHVERLALLPDGVVAIVQEESRFGNDKKYSDSRIAMGIMPAAIGPGEWVRKWEHGLLFRNPVSTLLEDSARGVIYFPDAVEDELFPQFAVRGLRVKDGKLVSGFPANFRADATKGEWTGVRMTGTAVDFDRDRLYIHDASKNRIVAVELKL